jgi:hypothetical protein
MRSQTDEAAKAGLERLKPQIPIVMVSSDDAIPEPALNVVDAFVSKNEAPHRGAEGPLRRPQVETKLFPFARLALLFSPRSKNQVKAAPGKGLERKDRITLMLLGGLENFKCSPRNCD